MREAGITGTGNQDDKSPSGQRPLAPLPPASPLLLLPLSTMPPPRPDGDYRSDFQKPLHSLLHIARDFSATFHELALRSPAQFLPTPITSLPDGTERGRFLALDLGGSNLRVGVVELFGKGGGAGDAGGDGDGDGATATRRTPNAAPSSDPDPESISPSLSTTHSLPPATDPDTELPPHQSGVLTRTTPTPRFRIAPSATWPIPAPLKSANAEALFDWVGQCIASVIRTYLSQCPASVAAQIAREGLPLGVTFSFPMVQESHNEALVMPMGKGFTFATTNDLASLLGEGYAKQRRSDTTTTTTCEGGWAAGGGALPKVEVLAITNDSISTLLAGCYTHQGNAAVGIIAGTGTNATCLCPVGKLGGFKYKKSSTTTGSVSHVLLNTEWSINGTLPPVEKYVTRWDRVVDSKNEKPGFQPLEEMVGGRYLGELVRLVSVDTLMGTGMSKLPGKFYKPYAVETKLCADVEGATGVEEACGILQTYFSDDQLPEWEWDNDATATFKHICESISTRAAALVAAATVGILTVDDNLGLHRETSASQPNGGTEPQEQDIIVSFTGTILEQYPRFRERCQGYLEEILERWYDDQEGPTGKSCHRRRRGVKLVEARDGGVIGAAVLAGMVRGGKT